jgi:hypothetical protein
MFMKTHLMFGNESEKVKCCKEANWHCIFRTDQRCASLVDCAIIFCVPPDSVCSSVWLSPITALAIVFLRVLLKLKGSGSLYIYLLSVHK